MIDRCITRSDDSETIEHISSDILRHFIYCSCDTHSSLPNFLKIYSTYTVHPSITTSLTASTKMFTPFSRSTSLIFNGGMNLMTSYTLVVRINIPFSMHFLATLLAIFSGAPCTTPTSVVIPDMVDVGDANSTPTIKPFPRTSRIYGETSAKD